VPKVKVIEGITSYTESIHVKKVNQVFGRINAVHFAAVSDLKERDMYVCGPELFMQGTLKLLSDLGVDSNKLFVERFNF